MLYLKGALKRKSTRTNVHCVIQSQKPCDCGHAAVNNSRSIALCTKIYGRVYTILIAKRALILCSRSQRAVDQVHSDDVSLTNQIFRFEKWVRNSKNMAGNMTSVSERL